MQIQTQEDVAVLLMTELAHHHREIWPLSKTAQLHGLSPLYLKKIARQLKIAGLVRSKEGTSGGYQLARPPQKINLWQIMQVFSHRQIWPTEIIERNGCPLNMNCLPQVIRKILADALEKSFSQITLRDLVQS